MQCVRVLFASRRCFPTPQNICTAATWCTASAKAPHFPRIDVNFKKAKWLNVNLTRCLCSCSSARECWSDQTFALDTQKLQRKYIELQRSLHPDNFSQKSQTERRYSEEQSALINKAYRTLQKPLTRSVYLLQLRGVELDEGTDSTADPALLLEVMEVNERLAETRSLDEVNAVGQEVQVTLRNLTAQMNAALSEGDLKSAREILARMKYFANLEEKVKERRRENL